MHYKVSGKGKTVVLIHGFMEEGSMWNDVTHALSKNHKVIVPDLEGFGNSPQKHSGVKLSMEKYAADIFEMLKKEKVKKCIMLGHSMGGYVTLHFAEKHPEMLSAFGLINSHCFEDTPEKKASRQKTIEFIRKNGIKEFVRELYHLIFHESFRKKNRKLIESLMATAMNYSPETATLVTEAMMNRKGKEEVLKRAQVPVLFINGKDDPAAPFELTLKQASFPSEAHIHFFANSAHMSIFEKKRETIRIIEDFCRL